MLLFFAGRGPWVPIIGFAAMVLPIIAFRQIDGEPIDNGVAVTMTIAAIVTFVLGRRWNRATPAGSPALHSFMGLPFQYWAVPMVIFALLLGTGVLNTAEGDGPSVHPASREAVKAAGKTEVR